MKNISKMLLLRLGTSYKPFYDPDEMSLKCNLLMFSGKFLLFLTVTVHFFKRVQNCQLIIIVRNIFAIKLSYWFLDLRSSPPYHAKHFKNIAHIYIY